VISIGPAGWSYPDWEGIVYPRKKPRDFNALTHLARFVDHVEVNSSFYGAPRREYCASWIEALVAAPNFTLSAKLQDAFTHRVLPAKRVQRERLVETWRAGIEPLRASARLRAVLVQFPVEFRNSGAGCRRLEFIADHFGDLGLVLEVRHRSWFTSKALSWIEAHGYSLAHIDLPAAAEHPPETWPSVGPIGYLRLHGRNSAAWFDPNAGRDQRYNYLYSLSEIERLAKLGGRITKGSDEAYGITNNHFSGKAMANALELMSRMGKAELRAPLELLEAFPRLRSIVQVDGQNSLFL